MLEQYRDKAKELSADYNTHRKMLEEASEKRVLAMGNTVHIDRVMEIINTAAMKVQDQFSITLGEQVTRCIHDVIDNSEDKTLKAVFEQKRGQTEVRFALQHESGGEVNPLRASGLGLADVAAFALRVSLSCIERPRRRPFIMLDEPFKFLHGEENTNRAYSMLKQVCDNLGIQALVVTQEPVALSGCKNYAVTKRGITTTVKEIK